MELEAIKPIHRSLASLSEPLEDQVAGNAPVITDGQRGGIGDGKPVAFPWGQCE
jgi:hypothetical protein